MNWLTIITMILVLSVVWGGFLFCLTTALRREKEKSRDSRS